MLKSVALSQELYPIIGYFLEEWLLVFGLIGQLVISSCQVTTQSPAVLAANTEVSEADEEVENPLVGQKRRFFFLVRFTQLIVGLCLVVTLFNLYCSIETKQNIFLLAHCGNMFFRQDGLTLLINALLTGITLHYLHTLMFIFTQTRSVRTYVFEFPMLVLMTLLSLRLFIATNDLMLMLLLVELAAFCSVILIGMQSLSAAVVSFPLEAAIKYFVINALAVTFLFFAVGSYYGLTTTTNLLNLSAYFIQYPYMYPFIVEQLIFAQGLFLFAYFIKLGAAPFHQWVPDVYEGAETAITAFLVLLIGPALNFKLALVFNQLMLLWVLPEQIQTLFLVCGLSCIVLGTLNAFYQTRIKRFIAYAGLTHLGFMLLALNGANTFGLVSFFLYLLTYITTNIVFFTLLLVCQQASKTTIVVYFNQLKTFLNNSKVLLIAFLICLFSFAGIPPLAGFFGKAFVLLSLLTAEQFSLVLTLIVFIIIGAYMYLRIIKIALFEQETVRFYTILTTFKYYSLRSTNDFFVNLPMVGSFSFIIVYWCLMLLTSMVVILPYFGWKLLLYTYSLFLFF